MNDLLFVYGSLLTDGNEFAGYLHSNAQLIGTGNFKGLLYDVGEYPGAVVSGSGAIVKGNIYKLANAEKALQILDDYEGFGPNQQQPNLFIRESLPIETDKGQVSCWVYLYNISVVNLPLIPSGNYQQYLKSKA